MDPLLYFAIFKYVPTVEEYNRFYPHKKIPKKISVINGRVVNEKNQKYLKQTLKKEKISKAKIKKREGLLRFLGKLPWVKYLGFSGTVSMLNATKNDDVDIFVISKKNRLFSARFFLLTVTSLLNVRRLRKAKEVKDKLCFNLFFSETALRISLAKQTEYVAHEILQLKTVVNKDKTYERFLQENRWVFTFFPNAKKPNKSIKKNIIAANNNRPSLLERILEKVQLSLISRHRTKERVSKSQLWFFPKDYENTVNRKLIELAKKG
jgi:hypothetical protein